MNDASSQDLQAQLQNDPTGERRTALLQQLRGYQDQCQAAKRQLHAPDAFARVNASAVAVAAAIRIVEGFSGKAPDSGN